MAFPTKFPSGVTFLSVPYAPEDKELLVCSMPTELKMDSFADKKVVLVAVPASFSPTCSVNHIPGYIAKEAELKAKGVDKVIVLSIDNPFSNSAWSKALGVSSDFFAFATDAGAAFSTSVGYGMDTPWGKLTGRWAAIVDKGEVKYAEEETNPGADVTVSSVDTILSKL